MHLGPTFAYLKCIYNTEDNLGRPRVRTTDLFRIRVDGT